MHKKSLVVTALLALALQAQAASPIDYTPSSTRLDSSGVFIDSGHQRIARAERGILPSGWQFVFTEPSMAGLEIDWKSGQTWTEALNLFAKKNSICVLVDGAKNLAILHRTGDPFTPEVKVVNSLSPSANELYQFSDIYSKMSSVNSQSIAEEAMRPLPLAGSVISPSSSSSLSATKLPVAAKKTTDNYAAAKTTKIDPNHFEFDEPDVHSIDATNNTSGSAVKSVVATKELAPIIPTKAWHVKVGSTLKESVTGWAEAQSPKWTVVWGTDVDYPIQADFTLYGQFIDVVAQTFNAYSGASQPLYVDIHSNQHLIYVSDKGELAK